jgi:hypothetical protein
MSDPFSMLTAGSAAVSGIGSLFGAGAASQAGQDRASMDNYKAYVAAQNAQIALQNRQRDLDVGRQQSYYNDLKVSQQVGSATADAGASGFSIGDSPTIKAGIDSVHQLGRVDSLNIMDAARFKAYGALIQSYNYTQEALMDQSAARNDQTAGDTAAMSSLLGGATSIADKWAGYYRRTA